MSKTLKEKTAHGIFWNFLDKFGQQALNILVTIVLMRFFLTPDDYGLVSVIFIVNALGFAFIDSGFSNALIRKKEVTQTDLSSVFYFNIVISLLFYLLIFCTAPLIAHIYHKPVLTGLVRVMALSLPLCSMALVQTTLLTKSIDFKRLASTNLIAIFCSGALSLFLAWKGYGVWVLVIQPFSITLVRNICLWSISSWRPSLIYSRQSIQNLWKYSSKLLISSTVSIICKNIYSSLIAFFYPFKEAGFYFNANKYSEIPHQTIIPAIHTTVYPAMTNLGDNPESLKNAFRKMIRVASFIFFPVMLGLIATADPLMLTVFGVKWIPIVPYFKVLCVGYLFMGINSLYTVILFLKGKSSAVLFFNLLYSIALLLSIVLTVRISVWSMAISWTMVGVIYTIVYTSYVRKMIQYTVIEQLKDILPYFILATTMGIGIYLFSALIHNNFILVSVQIITGAIFYISACYLLGSKVFREAIEMIKNKTVNVK
ncbi:MAG: lipopolysaccharide biosynthesis protein [Bacteroidetes bacterium]|nr:lipopolysaccharide biosynthesis protein [Bacteroidota bacterium]MCL1968093.1 lipopolysaccharide biosynthesis protein [Bacteroidota bacterium]